LARQFATDNNLGAVIAEAIAFPGFALVEILETCTGYGALKNKATGNALREVISRQGYSIGRIEAQQERPAFGELYRREMESRPPRKPREEIPRLAVKGDIAQSLHPENPDARFQIPDSKKLHIVIAGTAGERVQSSAALLCRAALSAGLYSTQKNDNPVTQGSGFSLSEICLSPQPIEYTGMESADIVIAVSQDGLNELEANGTLAQLTPRTLLLVDAELEISSPTGLLFRQPFRRKATPKRAALAAIAFWLDMEPLVPSAAWEAVVASLPAERREEVAAALRVGASLASQEGTCAA
jgi:hypothetical protein